MLKSIKFVCLFILLSFLGGLSSSQAVESASLYKSLHDDWRTYSWLTAEGNMHSEKRKGFIARGELIKDGEIQCGLFTPSWQCDSLTAAPIDAQREFDRDDLRLRVFVPPGTLYFSLKLYLPRDANIASVTSFDSPPTTDHDTYQEYSVIHDSGARWDQLKAFETTSKNAGGHIEVAQCRFSSPLPEGEEGWVYVRLKLFAGSISYYRAAAAISVDLNTYTSWYEDMVAKNWAGFDESAPIVIDNGDQPVNEDPGNINDDSDDFTGGIDDDDTGNSDDNGSGDFIGGQPDYDGGNSGGSGGSGGGSIQFPTGSWGDKPGQDKSGSGDNTGGSDDNTNDGGNGFLLGLNAKTGANQIRSSLSILGVNSMNYIDSIQLKLPDNRWEGKEVNCYGALLYKANWYIAQVDNANRFAFVPLDGYKGDPPPYGHETIHGNSWTTSVFKDLQLDGTYISPNTDSTLRPFEDAAFYFVIAPEGDFSQAKGVGFKFGQGETGTGSYAGGLD